jgi:hypothetical protein
MTHSPLSVEKFMTELLRLHVDVATAGLFPDHTHRSRVHHL